MASMKQIAKAAFKEQLTILQERIHTANHGYFGTCTITGTERRTKVVEALTKASPSVFEAVVASIIEMR